MKREFLEIRVLDPDENVVQRYDVTGYSEAEVSSMLRGARRRFPVPFHVKRFAGHRRARGRGDAGRAARAILE